MSGRNSLRYGDPGYGLVCACGNRKHAASRRCNDCYRTKQGTSLVAVHGGSGLWRESIVTFRNERTGEVRTRHCHGSGVDEQILDGLRHLPDGPWVADCRSTPRSILNDLRRRA